MARTAYSTVVLGFVGALVGVGVGAFAVGHSQGSFASAMIGLAGAVVGAWVGAYSTHDFQLDQWRRQLTLQMFREYHGTSLHADRVEADKLLGGHAGLGLDDLYRSLAAEDWGHVARVRHFWSQLALLSKTGNLDTKLAAALFADDIAYWRDTHFLGREKGSGLRGHWPDTWKELDALLERRL